MQNYDLHVSKIRMRVMYFFGNFKYKIFKNDPGNFDGKITIPWNVCKILPDETIVAL